MGGKFFNKLPHEIKSIETMPLFRKSLKQYLIENVFYSVKQFINPDCIMMNVR